MVLSTVISQNQDRLTCLIYLTTGQILMALGHWPFYWLYFFTLSSPALAVGLLVSMYFLLSLVF